MHSLSRRLLLSVAVPLALFFGVTMLVLDQGFQILVSERQLHALLDAQMVTLIAAAEPNPAGGYDAPLAGLDARLATPDSGLYAQIRSNNHVWSSPSTAAVRLDFGPALAQGERQFSYAMVGHERIAIESRGISFQDDPKQGQPLTFSVAVSLAPYEQQLALFRSRMLVWFSGLMALLLLALAALLRRVLAPLRRLEREIHEVEEGRSEKLGSGYPRELSGAARHLNALLVGERKRVARYRDTLGNLAHGLKTPLAVIRSALTSDVGSNAATHTVGQEIDRMTDIIEHQLKRAASGGALLGQAPLAVGAVAAELRSALLKVYGGKDLAIELAIQEGSHFIGDRGDFVELLGNLMDNACKWCREKVRVSVAVEDGRIASGKGLTLTVEDDGPGIAEENRARVLERGVRTDGSVPGHGLGLAMVHDTVDLYGGILVVDASPLGGARFSLRLPGKITLPKAGDRAEEPPR